MEGLMADSLYRQWQILNLIPSQPKGLKIQDIIGQLEAKNVPVPSYRTIQRDLNTLAAVFPLLCSEQKQGAFYWFMKTEEGLIEIPRMSAPTALAFYLAESNLQNQLPLSALSQLQAHFKTAKGVLKYQPDYIEWIDKVRVLPQTQSLIAPEIDTSVLEVIYAALLNNTRFMAKYFARRDDQYKAYLVNPIALVLRGTVSYLVCTLRDYSEVRVLSLHRFIEAIPSDQIRWVPDGFSLDAYIKAGNFDFLLGDEIELVLRIDEEVAIHLRESKLTQNQSIELLEDGKSLFTATIKDTGQLRWWLLGFAAQVEVLEPESLRVEFAEKAKAMAGLYTVL